MTDATTPEEQEPLGLNGLDGLAEEAWESEIGDLLGGMPLVEPPDGFIDAALDHRPMYAGRTSLLAVLGTFVVVVAVSMSGLLKEQTYVPDLEALVSRHSATEANLLGNVLAGSEADDSPVFQLKAEGEEFPFELPGDLEWSAMFEGQDLEQAVFAAGDHTVSVFVEPGRVDFESLSAEGRVEVAGVLVWSDPQQRLVIVQASDAVITVVGLNPLLIEMLVAELEAEDDPSRLERLAREINRATSQLGFPELD